jgi:hypothetical protein
LFALGCTSDEKASPPAPALTTEAGVPAPASPTRTVGHRNPFGDAFQSDNLMVDGDFELTGRTDGIQEPWFVYTTSPQTLNFDTGGHCRSGIRCAVIVPNDILIGQMASPASENFVIRAYVKPESGHCADAQVFVFDVITSALSASALSTTQLPGDDGWCFFEGQSPALVYQQPALYIQITPNGKSKTLVVDQVSVLPASKVPVHGIMMPPTQPSAELRKRIESVSTWIRTHRKYGRNVERETP